LDEPLGALDLKLREAMKIELKLLQHQFDTTFVYITHDQSEALVMSDNVAIMNEGKFVQIGTPQELYHKPAAAFVAGFVGDTNRWSGRVSRVEGTIVEVETGAGLTMRGSVRGSGGVPSVGDAVNAFVRPEFITAERSDGKAGKVDANQNVIEGKIDSILFNGANSRVLVRDQAGELIEADVVLTGGTQDLKPKDHVTLSWSAEQTMSFAV
ncbi:MAG: ABC transporter ATP-binding protein, partial [Hoeflea sp.]|nr:ABC transporter ATP-binding protein [Hoeflea sp.]